MNSSKNRLAIIAVANLALLQGITLWADARWAVTYLQAFLYLVAIGMAAKIIGDLIYYLLSPGRRHWLYLDDYLLNDLLVHSRFLVPLAIAQGWVAAQAQRSMPFAWLQLRRLWVSPLLGVILWAVNRYLVEQAEDKRHRPVGTHAAALTSKPADGKEEGRPGRATAD